MEQRPIGHEESDSQPSTYAIPAEPGEDQSSQIGKNAANGLLDETEAVEEIAESIAEAATVSHQDDEEDGGADHNGSILQNTANAPAKKRKRKKTRPKSQRGLDKPTGFEEYHADAPLTPAQHAEEQELYHRDLPFTDRILTAVQRFERHRKLDPQRRDVFYKWLSYGGVEVGPNMFQSGLDYDSVDKDQLVTALAQTSIGADKHNVGEKAAIYAVDFQGCMKGFLSRRAVFYYGFETESQVQMVTNVLSRFMDYLLQHDVCPEYSSDVLAARDVCKIATKELWACAEAQRWLPGDFNVACSTLFDGHYAQNYDGIGSWQREDAEQYSFVGLRPEEAQQILRFAISCVADEAVYDFIRRAESDPFEIVSVDHAAGFEIVKIEPVSEKTRSHYKTHSKAFRPVGRVSAKAWVNPEQPQQDLTAEEQALLEEAKSGQRETPIDTETETETETETYEFFLEEVILQKLFVGMKIQATIRKLKCGIWFFDEFLRAYCSFDTWLCNELMVGWKEPRPIEGAVCYAGEGMGKTAVREEERAESESQDREGGD